MLCSLCCLLLPGIEGRGVTLVASWGWLALRRRIKGIECSSCTSANCPHRFLLHNPPFTSSQDYSVLTCYFCVSPVAALYSFSITAYAEMNVVGWSERKKEIMFLVSFRKRLWSLRARSRPNQWRCQDARLRLSSHAFLISAALCSELVCSLRLQRKKDRLG